MASKGGRHLHVGNAAKQRRGDEPGDIPDHTSADGHQPRIAPVTEVDEPILQVDDGLPRLRRLSRRKDDAIGPRPKAP